MVGPGLRQRCPEPTWGRGRIRRMLYEWLRQHRHYLMAVPLAATQPGTPSRRRWARTIMRARMRSPRCIRSRCSAVYAVDDFFGELGLCMDVPSLPAFLIPLLQPGLGGIADWLTAVGCRTPTSIVQSAALEERALSLGRDYMHVMGLTAR